MNSLDMLSPSSHYFYKKCMGTRKETLHFNLGIKGLRGQNLQTGTA